MRNLRLLSSCLCGCLLGFIGPSLPAGAQQSVPGQWAWMSGSSTVGSNCVISSTPNCGRSGTYGTMGTPAAGNTPGGRYQSETWVDSSGNFWLYGGLGFDANGNWGALSDLWRFDPS